MKRSHYLTLMTLFVLGVTMVPVSAEASFSVAVTDVDFIAEPQQSYGNQYQGRFNLTLEYWNPFPETQHLLFISDRDPDIDFSFSLSNTSQGVAWMVVVQNYAITKSFSSGVTTINQDLFIYHNNTNAELPPAGNYTFTPREHCVVEEDEIDTNCQDTSVTTVFPYTLIINQTHIRHVEPDLEATWGSVSESNLVVISGFYLLLPLLIIPKLRSPREKL